MGKSDKVILFDMNEKDIMLLYDTFFLASYLKSKRYNTEYCDLLRESFNMFMDKHFLSKTFEEFEKDMLQKGVSFKKKIRQLGIQWHIKAIKKKYKTNLTTKVECADNDFLRHYLLFSLLLGAKHHYTPKEMVQKDGVNTLLYYLIPTRLYSSDCSQIFAGLFFSSEEFQRWMKHMICNKKVLYFSFTYPYQNNIFKIIASGIKRRFPEKKIIVGGPWVTHNIKTGLINKEYFNYCDFIILGEGEKPLSTLIRGHKQFRKMNDIPNVVYLKDGDIKVGRVDHFRNLNDLPIPEFSKEFIRDSKISYIPYETGRGCSWHKCIFCGNFGTESVYREKIPKKIVSELQALKKETGISDFKFINNELRMEHALQISKEIIKRKLNISWESRMRFNKNLSLDKLTLLKSAGCEELRFGLESGDKKTNKIIKKGVNIEKAAEIIKNCKKAGINVVLLTVVGFPFESLSSVLSTIRFIRKNKSFLSRSNIYLFVAVPNTPIVNKNEKYGIKKFVQGGFISDSHKNTLFRMYLLEPLLYTCSYLLSNEFFELRIKG
jgi:radical SAM superfamily enzyme YgiQ (UPF0313 family)